MAFDPDQYLASKQAFDPDAYLTKRAGNLTSTLEQAAQGITEAGNRAAFLPNFTKELSGSWLDPRSRQETAEDSLAKNAASGDPNLERYVKYGAKENWPKPTSLLDQAGAFLGGGSSALATAAARNPILNKMNPLLGGAQALTDIIGPLVAGQVVPEVIKPSRGPAAPSEPSDPRFFAMPKGLGEQVQDFKEDYQGANKFYDKLKAKSPVAAIAGSIPKNMLAYKVLEPLLMASKIPGLAAGKGGSKIAKLLEGLKGVNRAGVSGQVMGQADDFDPSAERLAADYAMGAVPEAGFRGLGAAGAGLKKAAQSGSLGAQARGFFESIPGLGGLIKGPRKAEESLAARAYEAAKNDFKQTEALRKSQHESGFADVMSQFETQEAARKTEHEIRKQLFQQNEIARKSKHEVGTVDVMSQFAQQENLARAAYETEKKSAVDSFKSLIKKDPITAAEGLVGGMKQENIKLGKEFESAVTPVMKNYSSAPASAEAVNKQITQTLDSIGALDADGKIITDAFISPEYSGLVNKLAKVKQSLGEGVDIGKLDLITKQLQAEAKLFKNAGDKSMGQSVLSKVASTAKQELLDNLEKVATPEEIQGVLQARKSYAQKKPIIKDVLKLEKSPPERLSVNLRSKLPGSKIQELMEKFPQTQENLGELFLNMLTQHSVAPRKFTKEIDYYGRGTLKKLLGEERFNALTASETRLHKSAQPWAKQKSAPPVPLPFKPGQAPAPFLKSGAPVPIPFKPRPAPIQPREYTGLIEEILSSKSPIVRLMTSLAKGSSKSSKGAKYLAPELLKQLGVR